MKLPICSIVVCGLGLWLGGTQWAVAAAGRASTPQRIILESTTNRVGQFEKVEFRLGVPGTYTNAFDPEQVEVDVRFTAPDGQTVNVPAFFCQEYERRRVGQDRQRDWMYPAGLPVWKARFAPSQIGPYSAVAALKNAGGTAVSREVRFECVPSKNPGFVRVSGKDPRFLEFTTGQPFFPVGQNLAFIGSQQYVTLSKAEDIFAKLSANRANYLRIWTCCGDWAMAIEARKSAWGRSWDWRAPIVSRPDDPDEKCLRTTRDAPLRPNPSQPVALRPGTKYAVSGLAWAERPIQLNCEVNGTTSGPLSVADTPLAWSPFRYEFSSGSADFWLNGLRIQVEGEGVAFVRELSLREASGGPELLWEAAVDRPERGFYNPLDCFMLDETLAAAEKQGIYLQLCLFTRDVYMTALKDPAGPEYDQAIRDGKKLLRYAIGRWGYSTRVAAWEYWNEMDPGLPTDRFYAEMGEYLEQADPYRHLRTTSTWGPSAKDCRHAKLDIADVHFYLRPSDKERLHDEVEAVLERTRWLREQAPRKPAHLGEFGLANKKWAPTEEMNRSRELIDFHNALWASALSGASGTAMYWWWDRLDQRNVYPIYRPLSRFIADVPWTSGQVQPAAIICADERLRMAGLQAKDRAWLWFFSRDASWQKVVIEKGTPAVVAKAEAQLQNLPNGSYRIQWFDTREAKELGEERRVAEDGVLQIEAPNFVRDIACKISP